MKAQSGHVVALTTVSTTSYEAAVHTPLHAMVRPNKHNLEIQSNEPLFALSVEKLEYALSAIALVVS